MKKMIDNKYVDINKLSYIKSKFNWISQENETLYKIIINDMKRTIQREGSVIIELSNYSKEFKSIFLINNNVFWKEIENNNIINNTQLKEFLTNINYY